MCWTRATATSPLRSHANNLIVSAQNAGAGSLIANRTTVGSWETFQLVHNADGSVSLKALVNNMYVTAENAGAAAADRQPHRDRRLGRVSTSSTTDLPCARRRRPATPRTPKAGRAVDAGQQRQPDGKP